MIKVGIDTHSGFCGGVIRAISTAEDYLARREGALWSLGAIVHNEAELARLGDRGLRTVDHASLDSLGKGDAVLIRAHGEPPATYARLKELGLSIIDCTCPVVLRLQARVEEAAQRAQVIIFGKVGHPEVLGLVGRSQGRAQVVEDADSLRELLDSGLIDVSKPIELFSQTTMSPGSYRELEEKLRKAAAGGLTVHHSICAQVAGRHKELSDFASSHDVIIFVSGSSSSNGKVLFQWCKGINPRSHIIGGPEELRPEWFTEAESAGVCGATSTPKWLLENVASAIQDLVF
ncbi:MAG: 4-hydroxy-3-methylbut-2-enyl diphosphate reductase [Bacteroidales bacterium]|nr:4-hydroxy-3-methylbut-2-enyl diphosphate reductase [Bacteroidales bacterium]